ncbi:MAG: hypothetical protein JNM21_09725 [Taibaiella sp.]|nr:hypothetical protein [Taibaiella sp.]
MKRPFKIHEEFVLHHEDQFDKFMHETDSEFYKVGPKEYNEYRIHGNGAIGVGSINNLIYEPISVYLELKKKGNTTVLVLKNKLRIDALLITVVMLIVFLCFLYKGIVEGSGTLIGLGVGIPAVTIPFFNWIYYIQESGLAKHLMMVLTNNGFIVVKT